MATLYAKLGVSKDATGEEIKRAYRKAAMKWHPDRNAGQEDAARAAFQEIKDAYAILSDDGQRKVYDMVYEQEMRRWETVEQRKRQQQAQRARQAQEAADARYAEMVGVAMRFADAGHNRDVLLGVLLGRDCEPGTARRIADSVSALHASRHEAEAPKGKPGDAAPHVDAHADANADAKRRAAKGTGRPAARQDAATASSARSSHDAARHEAAEDAAQDKRESRSGNLFDSLWQGFFGVRS